VPPVAGAVHVILFVFAAKADTDGDPGVLGTVVTVTALDASEAAEVPAAFVAVTVNVGVAADAIPVNVIGEDAPTPV